MKSFCLERGCWQLSRRLKVHIWRESSDGKLVDVWKNSLICALHCSCSFQYRTGIELFLPCDHHWRGQPRATASASFFVGWTFGTGVDQGQWNWRLPGWVTVLCPRATTVGVVFNEEPLWRRWRPVVLHFAVWFSCSPASVWGMYRDQYSKALWSFESLINRLVFSRCSS